MDEVETVVRAAATCLLRDVALFDVYEGKGLPEGQEELRHHHDPARRRKRPLNDKAVDAVMNKIIANLTKQLGAELR